MIPNKNGVFWDVTESLNSLARLTLRELRRKASDAGVPLYSRKSKATLVEEITMYQKKKQVDQQLQKQPFWRAPSKADSANSSEITDGSTRVVFLPRDPEWAYVFWEISESDRERALESGANRLFIRLSDVTGIEDGKAHPHTLQEVSVDSHSTEWYLPIPLSDRDYRVELGYRFGANWMSLAFSAPAKVPSLAPSNQILDQFVPFSLDANVENAPLEPPSPIADSFTDNGLHERLYQTATTNIRKTTIGSEEFQEHQFNQSEHHASGAGLWDSGRNESGVGSFANRKRSLWLVADAELIVYGATDPSARLTIGGEEVPLTSDGTFRLQVPFRDGQQKYAISASAFNGEQSCNVTLDFERSTPEDNSITKENAQPQWF